MRILKDSRFIGVKTLFAGMACAVLATVLSLVAFSTQAVHGYSLEMMPPPCPVCNGNSIEIFFNEDGTVAYYECHGPKHAAAPYVFYPSSNVSETVYHSVTYKLYTAADGSYTTKSISVEDWGYHRIGETTIDEYTSNKVRYVFSGNWLVNGEVYSDNDRIQVKSDITIEPVYDAYYTLTYLDADQRSTYKTFEVKGGDTHSIITDYPVKAETDKNTYKFAGWTFSREPIAGKQVIEHNMIFYPTYDTVPKTSTVKYLDAEGNLYKKEKVNRGTSFKLPTTGPEKAATDKERYEFAGWAVNGVLVESKSLSTYENMTITPVYNTYPIEQKATATPVPRVTPVPRTTDAPDNDEDDSTDDGTPGDADAAENPDVSDITGMTDITDAPAVTDEPAVTNGPVNADETGTSDDAPSQGGLDSDNADAGKAGTDVSTEQTEDGDELADIEDDTTPLGAIVAGGIGATAVLAGAGFAIAKAVGAKTAAGAAKTARTAAKAGKSAKNAAKAADAAAKTSAVRDIEFETKTVLLAVADSDLKKNLSAMFGRKKFLAVKTTNASEASEIAQTAGKIKADVIIIDTLKGETAQSFTERVRAIATGGGGCKLAAVSNDSYTLIEESTFKALKADGSLSDYTSAGVSDNQKMVKLILPVYKPEISVDNTAEFIGGITDALGIPFVSTVVELFVNGKEIKEVLETKDVDVSDISTVIGNIASVFGLDNVSKVTELINGIDTARDVIGTEDISDGQ